MYVWCQDQKMPLGPGLLWKPKNGKFKKQMMLVKENASLEALQWLMWMESRMSQKLGRPITLEHAYHRGEKKVKQWKVDGYVCINGVNYYLEYNGMYFPIAYAI